MGIVSSDIATSAAAERGESVSLLSAPLSQDQHPADVAAKSVAILALDRQALHDDLTHSGSMPHVPDAPRAGGSPAVTSIRTVPSIPHLLRSLLRLSEDYVVFSPRPGLIWDSHLLARIELEIAAVEALGLPWFCLSADGIDLSGREYCSAYFNFEPTLVPDRGRRPIVQTAGTIFILKLSSLRALGLQRTSAADLVAFLNDLIIIGYARGLGTFFTSALYPCLEEHRGLAYRPIDDQICGLNPWGLLTTSDTLELFPDDVPRRDLLVAWSDVVNLACTTKYRFSFVVRTLLRRKHMLRRCLISIDYLRSSLDFEAEIVLASDIDTDILAEGAHELAKLFPHLRFVIADGRLEQGHSRVRNLLAGIHATSGTRVCIIDDDDYYTPQAVSVFQQACLFGIEEMIIFDTQVLVEKWLHAGVKPHREIVAYRQLYAAKQWADTLHGTNSIPFCGIIHPGWFLREIACEYKFDYDYSEDFIFHIYCFSHPRRPPVRTVDDVGAYQSHREADDNVSTAKDRRRWVVDTGNGLYQLLLEQGRTFDGRVGTQRPGPVGRTKLETDLEQANDAHRRATEALAALMGRIDAALKREPAPTDAPRELKTTAVVRRGLRGVVRRVRSLGGAIKG